MEAAKEFVELCLSRGFFGDENADRVRVRLEELLIPPQFQGTGSCVRFLVNFDIRRVVEKEAELDDCPTPVMLPAEWLTSLGFDLEKGKLGIFDENFVRQLERSCLNDFTGHVARMHPMVTYQCADPNEDIKAWERLLEEWQKEFKAHYEGAFENKTGS